MSKIQGAVLAASALFLAASAAPVLARPGGWNGPGWNGPGWNGPGWGGPGWGSPLDTRLPPNRRFEDSREGRIEASHFVAEGDAAVALGHGPVSVTSQSAQDDFMAGSDRAVYEAAVVDQLVKAGYDTTHADSEGGQVTELRISRDVLVPAEVKRSPVSGSAAMEVGTRGSAYGLAVNVDMTKPRTALVNTRLEARIVDKASGKVLWEGRAEVATRDGDEKWSGHAIASRLSEALFDNFPRPDSPPRG
ncbi:hypothetical protein [Novosphingobium album (ex Liu et al. 2023)]|uniref:DUF4136 domain-containing protein n=1 Tax=Novosphingobium album (ex Liu et al. 2023) TaxID=3031130 RepID=A0ABT5WMZ2_9SPHN|nr:hypothetical protein [Novosphingobium album (ex Liu et al. 2023)]MDE8651406.1 hypothetical protein [Novosphingobium album (ex Liu et al. 2023)]